MKLPTLCHLLVFVPSPCLSVQYKVEGEKEALSSLRRQTLCSCSLYPSSQNQRNTERGEKSRDYGVMGLMEETGESSDLHVK